MPWGVVHYYYSLSKSESDSIVEKSSKPAFKFGDGKLVPTLKKKILPTGMSPSPELSVGLNLELSPSLELSQVLSLSLGYTYSQICVTGIRKCLNK